MSLSKKASLPVMRTVMMLSLKELLKIKDSTTGCFQTYVNSYKTPCNCQNGIA